jgi:hypothetical protein
VTPAVAALAVAILGIAPPFQREDPDVSAGNAALAAGDADAALRRYARAEEAHGERAEILFDRGAAALLLGRLDTASDLFRRAAERADPRLASRALQNLGNARAAAHDGAGAAAAYRAALRKDPANEDARYDLEVLLRRGDTSAPTPTSAATASPQPSAVHPEPFDEAQGRLRADAQAAARSRGTTPTPAARDAQYPRPLDRQDAEALLEALRARERTLPAFGPERAAKRRPDAAKDW